MKKKKAKIFEEEKIAKKKPLVLKEEPLILTNEVKEEKADLIDEE